MPLETIVEDGFYMTPSQCNFCKHQVGDSGCKGFTGDVPYDILVNQFDHREPWDKNSVDYVFEPKDDESLEEYNKFVKPIFDRAVEEEVNKEEEGGE